MIYTYYNRMSFHATKIFIPNTATWKNLQNFPKAELDPSPNERLASAIKESFSIRPKRKVVIKMIEKPNRELLCALSASGTTES